MRNYRVDAVERWATFAARDFEKRTSSSISAAPHPTEMSNSRKRPARRRRRHRTNSLAVAAKTVLIRSSRGLARVLPTLSIGASVVRTNLSKRSGHIDTLVHLVIWSSSHLVIRLSV
jgi:hypothetical protein